MDELLRVIKEQHFLFPEMNIADIYKLIYQHCYGPNHMEATKEKLLNDIIQESQNVGEDVREFLDIGNNYFRVPISSNQKFNEVLADAMFDSINKKRLSKDLNKLFQIYKKEICAEFNLNTTTFDKEILKLKELGFPPVSHSKNYKEKYLPHYRVIDKEFIKQLMEVEK